MTALVDKSEALRIIDEKIKILHESGCEDPFNMCEVIYKICRKIVEDLPPVDDRNLIDADLLIKDLRNVYAYRNYNPREVHFSLLDIEMNINNLIK